MNSKIKVFEDKEIRKEWNEEEQDWYVSIVDVVGVLTNQQTQRSASTYWAVLKNRLLSEGANELLINCKQLKMKATDGGAVAKAAREQHEMKTGKKVVSSLNAKNLKSIRGKEDG